MKWCISLILQIRLTRRVGTKISNEEAKLPAAREKATSWPRKSTRSRPLASLVLISMVDHGSRGAEGRLADG